MSRETDSPFRDGNEPEPKTETTLTTRIRINIPGSRPIPPVVVRKPVDPSEAADQAGATGADRARQPGGPAEDPGPGPAPSDDSRGTSSWFAPRRAPGAGDSDHPATPPDGTPTVPHPGGPGGPGGHTGQPYAGGAGGGFAGAGAPSGRTDTPPAGTPAYDQLSGYDRAPSSSGQPSGSGSGLPRRNRPAGQPDGPTSGPVSGDMPLLPPEFQQQAGAGPDPAPQRLDPPPGITGIMKPPVSTGGAPGGPGSGIPVVPQGGPGRPGAPGAPGAPGEHGAPADPFGGFPGPGARDPYAGGPQGHDPHGQDGYDEPVDDDAFPLPEPAPAPAGKGRSKLVLLGVLATVVLGVAYGAGLLLDHTDVPNGTTVLGVDIGGSSQEDAVRKLDAALGTRATDPLKITVDGEEKALKPSVLGLRLDTESTVRGVVGRDYNPISVIGSLVGSSRTAEPAFTVDEEKLKAALADVSPAGTTSEGMVRFEDGKAVPVPGKPSMAVDADRAAAAVEAAYRARTAGGPDSAIALPVAKQDPKVTEAEIQSAIKTYGEPAMSGWVWLRAGDVEVPFSEKSISEFYTLKAGSGGKLVPVIDPEQLAAKYGAAFDGVVIDAGTGTVRMTPQHATAAIEAALRKPAPAEPEKRIALVPDSRSGG